MSSVTPGTFKTGLTSQIGRVKLARARYAFATEGGATGDIALRGDTIPSGALVVAAVIDVTTVPTSAGAATIAVKVQGAADINTADAISGAPWSTTGAKNADVNAVNSGVKTTAVRTPTITVGTAALTAGVFDVILQYIELS